MKCELYPEYFPYSFRRDPQGTRTDRLMEQLKKDTLIHLIEVKPQLLLAKDTGTIYHRTDHHWSPLGGYCVYRSIIEAEKPDAVLLEMHEPFVDNLLRETAQEEYSRDQ